MELRRWRFLAGRFDRGDLVQVRGLVRFDSDVRVPTQLRGLTPLHGQQFSALAATLPIPAVPGARQIEHWASGLRADALSELALPASGCGQVIGADQEGRAVALGEILPPGW